MIRVDATTVSTVAICTLCNWRELVSQRSTATETNLVALRVGRAHHAIAHPAAARDARALDRAATRGRFNPR